MNRDSRRLVHALLAGAFAWFLWPAAGAFAQDDGASAASASSAASAEVAPQSRRDRRRAAKTETAAAEAGAEPAAAAAAPAAAVDTEESAEEVDIVCKNIKPLGTRMAKRVCGTPAQWAAYERKTTDAASEDMRQIRNTGGVIATTPGPAAGAPP